KDRALGFPPLNERLARRMFESIKAWPLLQGFRGRKAIDTDRLIEALIRLSYLVADYPEIKELDINPLLVTPDNVVALDARIIIDPNIVNSPVKKFSHLALRPYPEEYVRNIVLKDGMKITLRPIKPEDEPLWMNLLASCSKESIYARFRYFFYWESHLVAVKYCYIDYDREIAIVAEHGDNEKKQLLGVGRLVADPDLETVEYAILITDAWQNKGLGGIITDYCMEIAQTWGIKKIIAVTTSDNPRMIELFRQRNFQIKPDTSSSLVDVSKELS
ncbi:GNAT family N-acetyltransferase, partial [bacterium]|nr:GNAT family N-acetyltransferase [candidate division CSSED10-310 bacterium]